MPINIMSLVTISVCYNISHTTQLTDDITLEMGRSFGSATCDYSAEVQPNFGKHSVSFVALHMRYFVLPADTN